MLCYSEMQLKNLKVLCAAGQIENLQQLNKIHHSRNLLPAPDPHHLTEKNLINDSKKNSFKPLNKPGLKNKNLCSVNKDTGDECEGR